MRKARPHQERALTLLKLSYLAGKRRPLLQMPTGAGKTFVAAKIFESARAKGKRVLFIVDAISLIDQTLAAFYKEGLYDIGVIQADHPMTDWSKPILIASVQTLQSRGVMPRADLVVVDEAHCRNAWLEEIMASGEWADVPFIGLSATPWSRGLGHVYDDLLIPVRMQQLIAQGLLSDFRVFAAAHPDLTGVKTTNTVNGIDYASNQLSEVMSEGNLIADIVQTWKRLGENRPTVCFAVDRAHAKKIQQRFEGAGIGCGYIDAYTDRIEREKIRKQLEAGEIKVVANVGCLTKGVDWALGCIILARPTRSEMLFVQMVGRGLRVNDGISDCIILDHADNTLRLGFVTDIHHDELCKAVKGERKVQERKEALPKECPACTFIKPPKVHECPSCGFKPEKQSDIAEEDGELIEVKAKTLKATKAEKQSWYSQINWIAKERGYSSGWVAHTYKERFGVWPVGINRNFREPPSLAVRNHVKFLLIRRAKSRLKVAA